MRSSNQASRRYSPNLSDISTSASEDEGAAPLDANISRMRSTSPAGPAEEDDEDAGKQTKSDAEVTCLWNDCGETFNSLQPFIDHLHQSEYFFMNAFPNEGLSA